MFPISPLMKNFFPLPGPTDGRYRPQDPGSPAGGRGGFAETVGAMPEVMELYRMAGDVDYMLRVVVPDIQGYDAFYKRLIASVPLKNVTSRFAMEKIKATTVLPIP